MTIESALGSVKERYLGMREDVNVSLKLKHVCIYIHIYIHVYNVLFLYLQSYVGYYTGLNVRIIT